MNPARINDEFGIEAYRGNRAQIAESCAESLVRLFDRPARIDPAYDRWSILDGPQGRIFPTQPDAAARLVAREISRAGDRTPIPQQGYSMGFVNEWPGKTSDRTGPLSVSPMVSAGRSVCSGPALKTVSLRTEALDPDDRSFIDYPAMRQALLAIVTTWQPDWCAAYRGNLWEAFRGPPPATPRGHVPWPTGSPARPLPGRAGRACAEERIAPRRPGRGDPVRDAPVRDARLRLTVEHPGRDCDAKDPAATGAVPHLV